MSKYVDTLKQAKDLLSKQYSYSNKLELENKSPNGVTINAEAVVSKPASALIKSSFKTGGVNVSKLQIGSDKKIALDASFDNAVQDVKLTFKATDGSRAASGDAISAVLGMERSDKLSFMTLDIDALKYTADASVVLTVDGFLLGGAAKAGLEKGFDVQDYNVMLGWKDKNMTAAVVTDKKFSGVTAGVFNTVSPTTSVAAVAKFPLAMKQAASVDVEAGFTYAVDANTTVAGKANSAGRVALSYKSALNSMATLTVSGEVDGANIGSDDNNKFGILLSLKA